MAGNLKNAFPSGVPVVLFFVFFARRNPNMAALFSFKRHSNLSFSPCRHNLAFCAPNESHPGRNSSPFTQLHCFFVCTPGSFCSIRTPISGHSCWKQGHSLAYPESKSSNFLGFCKCRFLRLKKSPIDKGFTQSWAYLCKTSFGMCGQIPDGWRTFSGVPHWCCVVNNWTLLDHPCKAPGTQIPHCDTKRIHNCVRLGTQRTLTFLVQKHAPTGLLISLIDSWFSPPPQIYKRSLGPWPFQILTSGWGESSLGLLRK